MKKKPPDFSDRPRRKFFPCRLYAIDLEEMISAARERKLNFSIADEKYVYDSIDEVKAERGERVMKLTLTFWEQEAGWNKTRVEIDRATTTITSDQDDRLVAFWHQLEAIVARRMSWLDRLIHPIGGFGQGPS